MLSRAASVEECTLRYKLLAGSAILALVAGWGAKADPIIFDPGGAHGWDFVANGGGLLLHVCTLNCLNSILGQAFSGPDTGTFTFGPADFLAGPEVAGVFSTNGTETFSYSSITDSDTASGMVTWNTIEDNTLFPTLRGSFLVTSSIGDSAFLNQFPVGSTADVEATVSITCSLTNLVAGSCPTNDQESTLFSGRVTDSPLPPHVIPGVPEPNMNPIFMLSLAAVGFYVSYTSRQQQS